MNFIRSRQTIKSLATLAAGAVLWSLCIADAGYAQRYRSAQGTIDAGTNITVRTNESINTRQSDGRVFSGYVDQDVLSRNGSIAIPRGSDVELVVRETSNNQMTLDLDSVMVNGQRYGIQGDSALVESERKEGLGANKRTGEYVGGGAVLGAIIGAIAGGGKGAAIGAGAGAATGAGVQVLTRGRSVQVPAETLLTFRLQEPLRAGVSDYGYMDNGVHYHRASGNNYPQSAYNRQKPGSYRNGTISVDSNNNVTWNGPRGSSVYVQVDNEATKLFAAGESGTLQAPWISQGHLYVFTLKDANGNEVAVDREDLRPSRRSYRR
jgi:hypothetical protein